MDLKWTCFINWTASTASGSGLPGGPRKAQTESRSPSRSWIFPPVSYKSPSTPPPTQQGPGAAAQATTPPFFSKPLRSQTPPRPPLLVPSSTSTSTLLSPSPSSRSGEGEQDQNVRRPQPPLPPPQRHARLPHDLLRLPPAVAGIRPPRKCSSASSPPPPRDLMRGFACYRVVVRRCCTGSPASRATTRTSSPRPARSAPPPPTASPSSPPTPPHVCETWSPSRRVQFLGFMRSGVEFRRLVWGEFWLFGENLLDYALSYWRTPWERFCIRLLLVCISAAAMFLRIRSLSIRKAERDQSILMHSLCIVFYTIGIQSLHGGGA